ncbi:MAG TPA: FadR/GntR family transcriptional regulator [Candidatus Dormibacteraeota bacterium]|nr:FadR/GntR family transcriptional regulator [Candidatus Dormibacteraeota bacterium]
MPGSHVAYLQVANELREQILAGELSAGERLPTEAELCQRFGVSRSTIREALRMLSSQRLVATRRGVGGGSSVAQIRHDDVTDMLRESIELLASTEGATVAELIEARELLEVPAARLAASRRSEEQLERLRASLPISLESVDLRQIFEVNRSFHDILLEASGNRLLRVVTEPLFSVMQTRFLRDRASREFWQRVMHEHAKILAAVEQRDPKRAGREMEYHLVHLRATYEAIDSRLRSEC